MDPLGIGMSPAILNILHQYPASNEKRGDGSNTLGYRFSSNADSGFNTYIARLDYHITSNGSESLFVRGETQNFKEPGQQQFPGQSAATTILDDSKGITIGLTSMLTPNSSTIFIGDSFAREDRTQGRRRIRQSFWMASTASFRSRAPLFSLCPSTSSPTA